MAQGRLDYGRGRLARRSCIWVMIFMAFASSTAQECMGMEWTWIMLEDMTLSAE